MADRQSYHFLLTFIFIWVVGVSTWRPAHSSQEEHITSKIQEVIGKWIVIITQ